MRLFWVVVAAVMGSGCVHRFECTTHGGDPVLELTTEHFVIDSDLNETQTRTLAIELEQLWDAWLVFFGTVPHESTRVRVVLSDPGASGEFSPGSAGFVRYDARPLFFSGVVARDDGTIGWSTNAHEMVHLVSYFWLSRQPRWLAEGLAEYLGDARFVRANVIRMGGWQWPGGSVDSLDTLWAWSEGRETGRPVNELYDSAGAYIHYLSNKDEGGLNRLWKVLQTEPSAREGFERVFPRAEWPELQKKVQAYLDERRFRGWETAVLRTSTPSTPRVLAPWEVHLLRRDYVEANELKRAETMKAVALAPTPLPVRLALAEAEDTLFGPEQTDVALRYPDEPLAVAMAAQASDLSPAQRNVLKARALELAPDDVEVLAMYAAGMSQSHSEAALAAAEKAVALAPWWVWPRSSKISALLALKRCDDALHDIEGLEALAGERGGSVQATANQLRKRLKKVCP